MSDHARHSPRVILRHARRGRYGEDEVLVLEMGLGGAKFEHPFRVDVGRVATFVCGPLSVEGRVRHSVLLPTASGVVYQTGVAFDTLGASEHALLLDLLVHEAQQQVVEWESNLRGDDQFALRRKPARRSAVAPRFVMLRFKSNRAWERAVTKDPNQPLDGVTVVDSTSDEEIAVLQKTYERAGEDEREFLRRVAMVAILEQMRE